MPTAWNGWSGTNTKTGGRIDCFTKVAKVVKKNYKNVALIKRQEVADYKKAKKKNSTSWQYFIILLPIVLQQTV